MMMKTETQKKSLNNSFIIKRVCFIAIFSAITYVLYAFAKFKMPIFPSFLDINFSMIPVIIAAFMLGPWDAAIIVVVRCLIKWIFPGTSTGYVGEIADVLMGFAACIPAGLIYHKSNFKHKGIIALALVVVGWTLMGVLSNIFINIPWYSNLYFHQDYYKDGVPSSLINMTSSAIELITFGNIKNITNDNFMLIYIVFAVIPFNLFLSLIVVLITAPVHSRLKILYDIIGSKNHSKETKEEQEEILEEDTSIKKEE